MIKNFKTNYLTILSMLAMLVFLLTALYNYTIVRKNEQIKLQQSVIEKCKIDSTIAPQWCKTLLDEGITTTNRGSSLYIFNYIMTSYDSVRSLNFVYPLIIFVLSAISINKILKSGMFKNFLLREKYSKYIKKEILKAYIPAIILPLSIAAFIVICNFCADMPIAVYNGTGNGELPREFVSYGNWFFVIYIFNYIIYGIFLCNIVLIISKKSFHYIVTVISSYLFYYVIKILLAMVGMVIYYLTGSGIFANLMEIDCLVYTLDYSMWMNIFYMLSLASITGIFVYRIYNNKESLVVANE